MAIQIEVRRRRFTREEYHRMAEAGILHEDDRVELIQGEIVQMTPIGRRHAACVAELTRLLVPAVGRRALVWPRNPIVLPDDTGPSRTSRSSGRGPTATSGTTRAPRTCCSWWRSRTPPSTTTGT